LYTKTVREPATAITATEFPANPSRTGYLFSGWNTAADGSGSAFTTSTTVSADITVYAQWTAGPPGSYAVTFRMNDSTDGVFTVKIVTPPATTISVADFPGKPTRTGYNFASWNTLADGSGSAFTASTIVSADITVYAQWTALSYTVSFDKNSGDTEAVPATKTVTSPATSIDTLPSPPTRAGYNFVSWNTAPDGSGTVFTASTPVSADITVYAQWAYEDFNISLDFDAGSGAFSQGSFTVDKTGGTQTRTVNITGSGYTNPRWYVDGELKGTGNSVTIDAADYGVGGHNLTLIISKSGVSWSREISFTVNS
jgi:uncharacterized repeat protein (TIGR02543 family)